MRVAKEEWELLEQPNGSADDGSPLYTLSFREVDTLKRRELTMPEAIKDLDRRQLHELALVLEAWRRLAEL